MEYYSKYCDPSIPINIPTPLPNTPQTYKHKTSVITASIVSSEKYTIIL